jgi:hypothetical protein
MNDKLVEQYEELKLLVESIQVDLVKNASGNKSAGIRTRKALRSLKKIAADLVKSSLSADKG